MTDGGGQRRVAKGNRIEVSILTMPICWVPICWVRVRCLPLLIAFRALAAGRGSRRGWFGSWSAAWRHDRHRRPRLRPAAYRTRAHGCSLRPSGELLHPLARVLSVELRNERAGPRDR